MGNQEKSRLPIAIGVIAIALLILGAIIYKILEQKPSRPKELSNEEALELLKAPVPESSFKPDINILNKLGEPQKQ